MNNLRNISISRKVIIIQVATATAVLLLFSIALIFYFADVLRKNKLENEQNICEVLAINAIPAIIFMNLDAATELLSSLANQEEILGAALLDNDHNVFAEYVRDGEQEFDYSSYDFEQGENHRFDSGLLVQFTMVEQDEARLATMYMRSDMTKVNEGINNLIFIVLVVMALGVLLAGALASLLKRTISEPIDELLRTTIEITNSGNYAQQVEVVRKDQLGSLTEAFNKMLTATEIKDKNLKSAYLNLGNRAGERTKELDRAYKELANRAALLERKNKDLQDFTYVISHDFKTPIRGISSLAAWLKDDLGDTASVDSMKHLELMGKRVERLDRLVNALLKYASIDSVKTQIEEVNIDDLVDKLLARMTIPAGFKVNKVTKLPTILADREDMGHIFHRLIDNAIKHHDCEEGVIEIGCTESEEQYEFFVADDGPGVPEKYREKVFNMFQTLELKDKHEYIGFGLAIVKKLISEQGNSMEIKDNSPKGAIFVFTWDKL